jgi:surfeit locus 1 family protein
MGRSLVWRLTAFAIVTLTLALGMSALGFWQLRRAQDKQELLDRIDRAALEAPTVLDEFSMQRHDLGFRAVHLSGSFLPDRQILLDNQLRDGQPGVRVYVPLRIGRSDTLVLVDRGWRPWPRRTDVPPLAKIQPGPVELDGVLLDPPGAGLKLGATVAAGWPLLLTRLELSDIEHRLQQPLLDWVLEDRSESRAESIRAGMLPPERHRGYALQWFGLALTLLIIYGVLAIKAVRDSQKALKP